MKRDRDARIKTLEARLARARKYLEYWETKAEGASRMLARFEEQADKAAVKATEIEDLLFDAKDENAK